jgi:GNAT superfamily N-acetyltransferase
MPQRPLEARRAVAPAAAKQPDARLVDRVQLRDATGDDIPALVQLINDAYRPIDWWLFERPRVRDEAEYRDEVEAADGTGIVAELDGVAVAHAALWLNRGGAWPGAWIRMFATTPVMQGHGIATMLIEEAEQRARAAGFDRLQLGCVRENGLQDYYESLGFSVDREERSRRSPHAGAGDATCEYTSVYMSKEL